MNKGLLQIAGRFAMVAEGYRKMASEGMEIPKRYSYREKAGKIKYTRRKRFLLQRLGLLWQKKSRAGKTQEIKQLLKEFGADKLSSVLEERYEELMKRAEVL